MNNLNMRLKNKIDVYGKHKFTNELEEVDYKWDKIKSIWSEIIPTGGALKTGQGDTIYADVSHKITIRANSITNLANDMYFMYKSLRFDIKFFQPNYKYKDSIEVFCSLLVQNPSDLGVNS